MYAERWFVCLVFILSCGSELPHEAPFDPASPALRQAKGTVRGLVRLEGETEHAGIDVRLQNGERTYTLQTEGDGAFSLTGAVPGTYLLHAEARYFEPVEVSVPVALGAGGDVGLITLPAKRAAVEGNARVERVENRTSALRGGVAVTLIRSASIRGGAAPAPEWRLSATGELAAQSYTAISSSDGSYAFHGVAVGEYTVVAGASGFDSVAAGTLIVDGEAATVVHGEIVLKPLTGFVEIEGTAGSGPSSVFTVTRDVTLKILGFNAVSMAIGSTFTGSPGDCIFDPVRGYEAAVLHTLPAREGASVVCVRLFDAEGASTEPLLATIFVDTIAPAVGALRVNDGGRYTNNPVLALQLTSSGALQMALAAGACPTAAAAWSDFSPSAEFTLVPVDDDYVVCARFRDEAGNMSNGVTAAVTLDRSFADAVSAQLHGFEGKPGRSLQSTVSLTITGLGADSHQMQVANDSGFAGASWMTVTSATTWRLDYGQGLKTVYVRVRDRAGNVSSTLSPSIEVDQTPPETPGLAVIDITGDGYALSVSAVELQWSASGDVDLAGFEVQRYVQAYDFTFLTLLVTPANQTTHIDSIDETVGYKHYYRIRAFDDLGNYSGWSVMAEAEPFAPLDRILWIASEWGLNYQFVPKRGTFSLRPSYLYEDVDGFGNRIDLNTDVASWSRPIPSSSVYGERLLLKTLNASGTLAYVSDVPLGLDSRLSLVNAGSYNAMAADTEGRIHMAGYGRLGSGATGVGFWYANDVTGALNVEMIDANRTGATQARFVDVAVDSAGTPHIVGMRMWGSPPTGATIIHYYPVGTTWAMQAVTSFTTNYYYDAVRPRLTYDRIGRLRFVYGTVSPTDWITRTYLARYYGGSWKYSTISEMGGGADLVYDSANHGYAFMAGQYYAYSPSGPTTWFDYPLPTTLYASYPDAATDPSGAVHVVFYDQSYQQLVYLKHIDGQWSEEVLQKGVEGLQPAISADLKGNVYVLFAAKEIDEQQLWTRAGGKWTKRVIDNAANVPSPAYASLAVTEAATNLLYYNTLGGEHRYVKLGQSSLEKQLIYQPPYMREGGMDLESDAAGVLHAAFSANSSVTYQWEVSYATNTAGYWQVETVDTESGAANIVALELDSTGAPQIVVNAEGAIRRYLRVSAGVWNRYDLVIPDTMSGLVTRIDNLDNLHIAYLGLSATDGARYLYHGIVTSGGFVDISQGPQAARDPSIFVDNLGNAHFTYDDGLHNLFYVSRTAAGWGTPQFAATPSLYARVAIDDNGVVHILRNDTNDYDLYHTTNAGGVWRSAVVDSDPADVGRFATLALDVDGNIHVLYVDKSNQILKYATNAMGQWVSAKLTTMRAANDFQPIVIDKTGRFHGLYWDRASGLTLISDFFGWLHPSSTGRASAW